METEKRNNCYDGWILPQHADQIRDLDLFWPTNSEFKIIFNTTFGLVHWEQMLRHFSNDEALRLREEIQSTEYFAWFLNNLQLKAMGYTVPVTEELVLDSLEDFIEAVAKPKLSPIN